MHYGRLSAFFFLAAALLPGADSFRFVFVGDRTGETQAGVYEQVWQELAEEKPAFVVSAGDTIQGMHDETAEREWVEAKKLFSAYGAFQLYLTPGNHDVWSAVSQSLFRKYSSHPVHYGFDYGSAHFTVLDNSRSEGLSAGELAFLEEDLREHMGQPLKFIVSHRPSWLVNVMVNDSDFLLHQIARKYGVQYVFAGHVHEMLHADLDGITYVSLPSAGGGLRSTKRYEDGWFFGYTVVDVSSAGAQFQIRELKAPYGHGRISGLKDWGKSGAR